MESTNKKLRNCQFLVNIPLSKYLSPLTRKTLKQRLVLASLSEANVEPCETSKTELFAKYNGFQPFTVFAKSSIFYVWQGFQYASVYC